MRRLGGLLLVATGCGAPPVPPRPAVAVEVDPAPTTAAPVPALPSLAQPCRLQTQAWRLDVEMGNSVWVDGYGEPMAFLSWGVALAAVLSKKASRVRVTLGGGGFELAGWMPPSQLPFYLRRPSKLAGVLTPHTTSTVYHRGLEGNRVAVGYALRGGVEPDVIDARFSCTELTLDRPAWKAEGWKRGRPVVGLFIDVAAPMSERPDGPVAVMLSPSEGDYMGELMEVVEERAPFTKVRWVRARETLEGWVPSAMLQRMGDDEPDMPEAPFVEALEERVWPLVDPSDPEAYHCPREVTLYLVADVDSEGYEAPVRAGRIQAGTFFHAKEEVPPEAKPKQAMRFVEADALDELAGTGVTFAVRAADLSACKHPVPLP